MEFKSVDDVLEFAIGNEEEAHEFYMDLASKMEKPWMKKLFESFAEEEKGHKRKLLDIKKGKFLEPAREKIMDLKIADYLVKEEPSPELDYPGALILAMKKEKSAFKLYTDLADSTGDQNLKSTFLALAQEEAKHKLRFEIEYDENVLTEN
jgi:rubrerythrin